MKPSPQTHQDADDATLMQRYSRDRDIEAIDLLFRRYADPAFRIAMRYCGNAVDAEDAVQTAFLKVLQNASQYQPKFSFRGWMMSIVINSCRMNLRKEALLRQCEKTAEHQHTTEPNIENTELVAAALNTVQALPELYRIPVWLHYMEGFSFEEVACALSLPDKTVYKQISRGLEQVRQSLAAAGFTASAAALPGLLASAPLASAPAALTEAFKTLIATKGVEGGGIAASAAPTKGLGTMLAGSKLTIAGVVFATTATVLTVAHFARQPVVSTAGEKPVEIKAGPVTNDAPPIKDPKEPEKPPKTGLQKPLTVLNLLGGDWSYYRKGTIWRYYETWQTETARLDSGQLVRVDPMNPRSRAEGQKEYQLRQIEKISGSPFPPADWRNLEFDDNRWVRHIGSTRINYRSLAAVFLRGKFQVTDPAKAQDLLLTLEFHGGAVVYLNGQEVGRAYLPQGALNNDSLADDYSRECYIEPDGKLLRQAYGNGLLLQDAFIESFPADPKNLPAEVKTRLLNRSRKMEVSIPSKLLRAGTNVLAIEAHRAPANPVMFTTSSTVVETCYRSTLWWDRVSINVLNLTAPDGSDWIKPNNARPNGIQVWNQEVMNHDVMNYYNHEHYGDPNESAGPVRLRGARNGSFSGEIVLSSTEAITDLKITNVEVSY